MDDKKSIMYKLTIWNMDFIQAQMIKPYEMLESKHFNPLFRVCCVVNWNYNRFIHNIRKGLISFKSIEVLT